MEWMSIDDENMDKYVTQQKGLKFILLLVVFTRIFLHSNIC
jgi:hypothetical protein